jgi:hypothetical protein
MCFSIPQDIRTSTPLRRSPRKQTSTSRHLQESLSEDVVDIEANTQPAEDDDLCRRVGPIYIFIFII